VASVEVGGEREGDRETEERRDGKGALAGWSAMSSFAPLAVAADWNGGSRGALAYALGWSLGDPDEALAHASGS